MSTIVKRIRILMPTIMMWIRKCIKPNTSLLTLIIVIIIGIVLVAILWVFKYMAIVGPVLGALISVIAVLGNETAKYCSSTSTLELSSLGLKQTVDPGLDVEVFEKTRRISAMVVNSGRATVKDVKAALTIRVRRDGQETHYLGDVLLRKSEFDKYKDQPKSDRDNSIYEILNSPNCRGYLVNEYNPHIIGGMLPWALPERIIARPVLSFNKTIGRRKIGRLLDIASELGQGISPKISGFLEKLKGEFKEGLPLPWPFTDYVHITSISPGQRNRLLIFEYAKLSDDEYLVMPFSEYGAPGPSDPSIRPYRACLRLDKSSELIMKVTVHGEGARSSLEFTLCVTFDKLAKIDNAVEELEKAKSAEGANLEQKFMDLLNALSSLICHDRSKRPRERPTL